MGRYFVRSASDKTDNKPFWFVTDRKQDGLNVTANLIRDLFGEDPKGAVFLAPEHAVLLAIKANEECPK